MGGGVGEALRVGGHIWSFLDWEVGRGSVDCGFGGKVRFRGGVDSIIEN